MNRQALEVERDPQKDFDFYMGSWKVLNRRLRERLNGCTQWDEFDAKVVARQIWGGRANMDEFEAKVPSGTIRGMTIRLYNTRTQQWSLYWANCNNGAFDAPLIGGFQNGVGEFYNQEMFEGRSIYVRFLWSEITTNSFRWEQSFSPDGGKNWETNWVMEFTRNPQDS